jgi:hypothetical protein
MTIRILAQKGEHDTANVIVSAFCTTKEQKQQPQGLKAE